MNEKIYNPYPFEVKIKNDLGEDQILEPCGGRGKVPEGVYDQSVLSLPPYDHIKAGKQERYEELDFAFGTLSKNNCAALAWAMCVDLTGKETKREMVNLMKNKMTVRRKGG